MRTSKRRVIYLFCALAVIPIGLATRRYGESFPSFIAEYGGDTLWALEAFLLFSFAMPTGRLSHRAAAAFAFSCLIELSQLYHAPWIDAVRQTTLGGLVLGFGFLWSDLLCYAVGVVMGMVGEKMLTRHERPLQ